MGEYIIAIDQSTSGTKAFLFDENGVVVTRADREHEQKISSNGWVAHDPDEIYRNTITVVREAIEKAGVDKAAVAGAAISDQRETALVWDRSTGKPVYDAIVWQCSRGEKICGALAPHAQTIRAKTGLRLSPYFSAAKIAWVLQNADINGARDTLAAGTIDSWLVYKLSGNHKTDYSNASRTQLFNINDLAWDKDICALFGVDPAMLGEVCGSDAVYGLTDFEGTLPKKIPIHAVMGDSHASLYGHCCYTKGTGKVSYGTGSSVMVNIGPKPVFCENLATSLAWGKGGRVDYVLEGNINYSCAVIKWLVDDVKLIASSKEAGVIAAAANPLDRCYLVPAFSGLGAPHWSSSARAILCGMSRTTGRAEIVKAAEESIAYQIADVLYTMKKESGIAMTELHADGGGAADSFLMNFQSSILGIPALVPANRELSAAGAAMMAAEALGMKNFAGAAGNAKRYEPDMESEKRETLYSGWQAAVKLALTPALQ